MKVTNWHKRNLGRSKTWENCELTVWGSRGSKEYPNLYPPFGQLIIKNSEGQRLKVTMNKIEFGMFAREVFNINSIWDD